MSAAVTVAGAGPAGLMAAEILAQGGAKVTIIDHRPAPARKFLLAGRGGLNLTHSEPRDKFLTRYGEAQDFLEPIIRAFPPEALVKWCNGLGIETFVGSSGRVFPKVMKASPLLRAWLRRLDGLGVVLKPSTAWTGFGDGPEILAFGGASWPELGSNAAWVETFRQQGIQVNDFRPANCRVKIPWTEHFIVRHAGEPIKNLKLQYGRECVKGEVVISREGLEGGAIYALSRIMRDEPGKPLLIDLKPSLSGDAIAKRLAQPRGSLSQSNFLRRALGLTPAAIALLHESKRPIDHIGVKEVALYPQGLAGLRRAISSAGGVDLGEVDANCQLRKKPLHYCVGEMLNWEAPTGGFLLQACFSTAVVAARDLLTKLA